MLNIIKYKTQDKSSWPPGPWLDEPDKQQWIDKETKLPCLILRNPLGLICGYVGVDKKHPLYKKSYDDTSFDAHGGLTYSDKYQEGEQEKTICHIPEENETDDRWWFGFDCAHSGDLYPQMSHSYHSFFKEDKYRDLKYVENECKYLARQLNELI